MKLYRATVHLLLPGDIEDEETIGERCRITDIEVEGVQ